LYIRKFLLGILLFFLIFTVFSMGLSAVTIHDNPNLVRHVTVQGDDLKGDGSVEHPYRTIGKAVEKAKPGDTVQITGGTYKENNIQINKDLTITGSLDQTGHCTYISGENTQANLVVNSGVKVIINNLKLQIGTTGGNGISGSAIINKGYLIVRSCNFTKNLGNYYNESRGGAAISNRNTLTVIDSNFTGNQVISNKGVVDKGGAVCSEGFLNMTNCIFKNNKVSLSKKVNIKGGIGGAVYSKGTSFITGCTFIDNRANNGGALVIEGSGVIEHCNFTNNEGSYYWPRSNPLFSTDKSKGGAVYALGDFTLGYCNLVGNNAYYGKAIYVEEGNVDARYNWWGKHGSKASNPLKEIFAPAGRASIKFEPWLDKPASKKHKIN
jgi:hypothetical protein